MSNEFPHEADDQMSARKSSQQRLLLLLLLLVGLFAYLYFFTGLIRPRQDQPAPQPAPEAMVKQPLPPRSASVTAPAGEPATAATATETAPAGKPGATAQAPTAPPAPAAKPAQPAAATAPAGKPAATTKAAPAVKPAAPAPEKSAKVTAPETKPAKPAAPAAKAKTGKPTAPATTAPGQAKAAKPAAAATKKKTAAKPAAESNGTKTQAAAAKSVPAKSEKAKLAAKGAAPAYALELNDDLLESETGAVTAKLKKAGISQVVKTRSQKGEPMHRLYLADFADRNEAVEQLERLKLSAPDAFMLRENGRYTVYAGSYLREGKAAVEQDRLYDKGVKLLLKSAMTPVAVVKLRAGSFADQASAEKAAKKLKQAGLSAKVVKVAK